MVAHPLRSDIEPAIGLGGRGIHMACHVTWQHEMEHAVAVGQARAITIASDDAIRKPCSAVAGRPVTVWRLRQQQRIRA